MNMLPEQQARRGIDDLLQKVGWRVQDAKVANLYAGQGIALRELPLKPGHGQADYVLYVDQRAIGVIEAKPAGYPLIGVEPQSEKYRSGLPDDLPAWLRPLPFVYQSTGEETRFTNGLDPEPRSRRVFAFHRPETLVEWVGGTGVATGSPVRIAAESREQYVATETKTARLQHMPPLDPIGLWPVQVRAIENLERSMAEGRQRALVQMATGSGKTRTACALVYRLIKHSVVRRVLFLVDRNNLGRQTRQEFLGYVTPDDRRKFTELYNLQHLQSNRIDPVNRVCIATIQRVYSILKDEQLEPELEEMSGFEGAALQREVAPITYNLQVPIETFDVIITDECHRSIYNLWRQVLEYFDATLIGPTATPSKQTLGFFDQNLVIENNHEQAVADGVNVDFDVYRIRTDITEAGSRIEAGYEVPIRDRKTRKERWQRLDEDVEYLGSQLDRDVVAPDQVRTIVQAFRDRFLPEAFPGRSMVPKTLIYAKDDDHAERIVEIMREEFGKGNDFCQKITYKTTGAKPEDLLASFRNSPMPRVAVTVDMIATGTDVKPLEVVFFMRNVRSRNFFEQMKGRGVRVISPTEFHAVTPDARNKDRFVIVDAVGVTESELSDTFTLNKQSAVGFGTLLDAIGKGDRRPETISTLAARLARLDRKLTSEDRRGIEQLAGGALHNIIDVLIKSVDPDAAEDAARATTGLEEPPEVAVAEAHRVLLEQAAIPLASNPDLRQRLAEVRRSYEQTIDIISKDHLLEAGHSPEATERAREITRTFEGYLREHKDEITAIQVLYSRPYSQPLTYEHISALAGDLRAPPRGWTPQGLWEAYQRLDRSSVRGSGQRILTDIVSLARFALGQEKELVPFVERVKERFEGWIAMQEVRNGQPFTPEQRRWLEAIRDHVAGSVSIDLGDLEAPPFVQWGGLGHAHTLFGEQLTSLLKELSKELAA